MSDTPSPAGSEPEKGQVCDYDVKNFAGGMLESYEDDQANDKIDNLASSPDRIPSDDQEIVYEYLTFKSAIPTRPILPDGISRELPPCPNLKPYANPFDWSKRKKRLVTWVACACNITAAYAAGSYAFPADALTKKWHISLVVYNLGLALFTFGFGVAPMVLAPFSEINGRRPVLVTTGVLFALLQLCCALTQSFAGMVIARFIMGCAGSTFSTMVGGILADIWVSAERNTPMVLFTGATLFGTGLGPLVSGFVAQHLDWRWVFYLQAISSGSQVTLVIIFFKETRGSILLSRKAKALNKWYEELEAAGCIGVEVPWQDHPNHHHHYHHHHHLEHHHECRPPPSPSHNDVEKSLTPRRRLFRWKVRSDEERATLWRMIAISLYRPMHMLITEPVVFWFSLWISFSWAILYLQFDALPLVYQTVYDFDLAQSGAVFAAASVGSILSTVLSIYQEKMAIHYSRWLRVKLQTTPEGRLYFTGLTAILMPAGIFWFGFSAHRTVPWIVPTLGVTAITMGIFSIFLATFNYSADVYLIYASSALAAQGLCRNLLAGAFPLITDQMFRNMGYRPATAMLGAIGLALTLVPWVLILFGPRIRARSRIARRLNVG